MKITYNFTGLHIANKMTGDCESLRGGGGEISPNYIIISIVTFPSLLQLLCPLLLLSSAAASALFVNLSLMTLFFTH
jgi:hypothetical protein